MLAKNIAITGENTGYPNFVALIDTITSLKNSTQGLLPDAPENAESFLEKTIKEAGANYQRTGRLRSFCNSHIANKNPAAFLLMNKWLEYGCDEDGTAYFHLTNKAWYSIAHHNKNKIPQALLPYLVQVEYPWANPEEMNFYPN